MTDEQTEQKHYGFDLKRCGATVGFGSLLTDLWKCLEINFRSVHIVLPYHVFRRFVFVHADLNAGGFTAAAALHVVIESFIVFIQCDDSLNITSACD